MYEGISWLDRREKQAQARFEKALPQYLNDVKKNSPFYEPVEVKIPKPDTTTKNVDSTWYQGYNHVPVDSNSVMYVRNGNFYFAKNKSIEDSVLVSEKPSIKGDKYIFPVKNAWNNKFDIY